MKNKLFLVVLVVLCFTFTVPIARVSVSDYERSLEPMKLSDVMVKLGKGEVLTPIELSFLQQQMDLVQNTTAITSGWIGADKQPRVGTIHADRGEFSISPIRGSWFASAAYTCAAGDNYIAAWPWGAYDSSSYIIPYSSVSGALQVNPIYANSAPQIGVAIGGTFYTGTESSKILIDLYNKSDDTKSAAWGISEDVTGQDVLGSLIWFGVGYSAQDLYLKVNQDASGIANNCFVYIYFSTIR